MSSAEYTTNSKPLLKQGDVITHTSCVVCVGDLGLCTYCDSNATYLIQVMNQYAWNNEAGTRKELPHKFIPCCVCCTNNYKFMH